MQIIYRKQLPGKPPRESRISGWLAVLIWALALLALMALIAFLVPFLIFGLLVIIALVVFSILGGWIYLAYRFGFRNLWEITKLVLGVGCRNISWEERNRRFRQNWGNIRKGRPGVWEK